MGLRRHIPSAVQQHVRRRANHLCEYCHTDETWQYVRFTIDHVVPLDAGGADTDDNLALACFHCNRRKSNRLTAVDPETGQVTPLFNPREQHWSEHFIWSIDGLYLIGRTAVGRATIDSLALNRERVRHIRAADSDVGRHPPANDPIEEADLDEI